MNCSDSGYSNNNATKNNLTSGYVLLIYSVQKSKKIVVRSSVRKVVRLAATGVTYKIKSNNKLIFLNFNSRTYRWQSSVTIRLLRRPRKMLWYVHVGWGEAHNQEPSPTDRLTDGSIRSRILRCVTVDFRVTIYRPYTITMVHIVKDTIG